MNRELTKVSLTEVIQDVLCGDVLVTGGPGARLGVPGAGWGSMMLWFALCLFVFLVCLFVVSKRNDSVACCAPGFMQLHLH